MIEKQLTGLAADLEALTSAPAAHRGPRCSVGTLLDNADADVAATLHAVLDMTTVSAVLIAETLSLHGDPITSYTVARHRRRGQPNGCRCSR